MWSFLNQLITGFSQLTPRYFFCIGGSRTDQHCPGNQVFNGQVCVDPERYPCPDYHHPPPPTTIHANIISPTSDVISGGSMPDGVIESRQGVFRVDGLSVTPVDQCFGRTTGLYADATSASCQGYIYCRMNRQQASATCGTSQRFSQQSSRCVPKYEVHCSMPDNTPIAAITLSALDVI